MAMADENRRGERQPADASAIDRRAQLDELLSTTFNSVLRIEEKSIASRITKGLTITEIHAIVAVGLHEANPMNVVASRLNVTVPTLTTMMNKLVAKGYVVRERDDADRRKVLVRLTKTGRQVYRAHGMFHRKMIDDALTELTDEEERVLEVALAKVKAFFEAQLGQ